MANHDERDVPAAAFRFAGGPLRLEAADSDATATPIRMLARTSQPIDHWFWGRVVHDMSGMSLHKDILPADYCHAEECGFLDKFELDAEQNLIVSGKLVPTSSPDDIARKIIERSKGGVPYEASIDFTGDGIVVEEVSEGFSAPVNGYSFEGPGVIIRQWPLRGVAVCPYGADMNTSTSLNKAKTDHLRCKFVNANTNRETQEVSSMSEAAAEVVEEIVPDTAGQVVTPEVPVVAEAVTDAPAAELANDRAMAARFMAAFGNPQGAVWFAEGLSFDAARDREVKELKQQVADLTKRLSARTVGEETPVTFSAVDDTKKAGIAGRIRMRR